MATPGRGAGYLLARQFIKDWSDLPESWAHMLAGGLAAGSVPPRCSASLGTAEGFKSRLAPVVNLPAEPTDLR